MFYDISHEELVAIQRYLDGDGDEVIFTDAPVKFLNMSSALRRKILEDLRSVRRENARLSARLERMRSREEAKVEAGEIPLLDFDSLEIAEAVNCCVRSRGRQVSVCMIDYMVYDVYANWLHAHRERLFPERPVAQEWGPCFWRIKTRLVPGSVNPDAFRSLAERNPGVASVVRNVSDKYAGYEEKLMRSRLVDSDPYRNAHKDRNGGKWNKELSDADILRWMNSRYTG